MGLVLLRVRSFFKFFLERQLVPGHDLFLLEVYCFVLGHLIVSRLPFDTALRVYDQFHCRTPILRLLRLHLLLDFHTLIHPDHEFGNSVDLLHQMFLLSPLPILHHPPLLLFLSKHLSELFAASRSSLALYNCPAPLRRRPNRHLLLQLLLTDSLGTAVRSLTPGVKVPWQLLVLARFLVGYAFLGELVRGVHQACFVFAEDRQHDILSNPLALFGCPNC